MQIAVFIKNRDFFGARLVHIPLLAEIKKKYPSCRLTIFSPFQSAVLFKNLGLAGEVRYYQKDILYNLRTLRKLNPNIIISLRPRSSRLNIVIGLSGAKIRLGYRSGLSRLFYTHTIKRDISIYKPFNHLNLLTLLDKNIKITDSTLSHYFKQAARNSSLAPQKWADYICIIPGGGTGEFKRWGIHNFIRLCSAIKKKLPNICFAFILGNDEKKYIEIVNKTDIAKTSRFIIHETVENLSNVALNSRLSIANDCGQAHIFQMLGRPHVGIMSNFDGKAQQRIKEWSLNAKQILFLTSEERVDIKKIPVEQVLQAAWELIDKNE